MCKKNLLRLYVSHKFEYTLLPFVISNTNDIHFYFKRVVKQNMQNKQIKNQLSVLAKWNG